MAKDGGMLLGHSEKRVFCVRAHPHSTNEIEDRTTSALLLRQYHQKKKSFPLAVKVTPSQSTQRTYKHHRNPNDLFSQGANNVIVSLCNQW